MTFNSFKGAAKPLDAFDIAMLAHRIDVSEDHLQAFLNVESRSQGFDRAGRPIILNEPHVFYRNLSGAERDKAVKDGLAYRKWGEKPYPKSSDDRYIWLHRAMAINETAALKSCSYGSTQVLGENFSMVGYETIQDMVRAFMDDEENHVEAMVKFILATGIADDMREERWATVARVYNGPGYKKNQYDVKMAREFAKLRGIPDSGWKSDEGKVDFFIPTEDQLKAIQRRLSALGYKEVGWADGTWGTKSRAAVLAFRADHGLPLVPGVSEDMMAALMVSAPREASKERAETTAKELRDAGSRTIVAADKGAAVGGLVAIGGGITAAKDALSTVQEHVSGLSAVSDALSGLVGSLTGISPMLLLALGAYIVYQQVVVKRARVEDHRTGKNPYPGGE